jgi:transcriptional regulator of acetoin/glycerol metabolism
MPSLEEVRREAEKRHIFRALQLTGGEIIATAEALGISRTTLWEKMKKLDIDGA